MRRLVSTVGLNHEEWLQYRKMGITGTDAGAICGLNPYASSFSVYQDKITEATFEYDNEAMRQGRDLEEYVARRFEMETGFKVRRANAIFQNEEHLVMLADFDRVLVGLPNGEKAGLECKTVSPYSEDKWKDGNIPLHYQLQVQHYLAVSGFDSWYVAALIYGREFIIRKIERDEEMIQNLILIEERFWYEHVMKQIPPQPDGSEDCNNAIYAMYSYANGNEIQLQGMEEALVRREELDQLIKKLEKEKATIEQSVKMQMGEASYALSQKYRISWTQFSSSRLDTKKLKEEEPEVYSKYVNETSGRRFIVKKIA